MAMFDPIYWMFMIPALILAGLATLLTKTTFSRYARTRSSSGYTGAQAAQHMLHSQGITDVKIEAVHGFLSDHYDPTSRTLRLSPQVYGSPSLSAIGVACHEAGHALQHASGYAPLMLRSTLVPLVQVTSNLAYWLILIGMFIGYLGLFKIGAILFGGSVLFALVTLPVEWDASARAKRHMEEALIVGPQEAKAAGAVLNAAFLTYVAAAVSAMLQLLYFLMRAGLLGGNDD